MNKSDFDIIDDLVSEWNKEEPSLDVSAMEVVGRLILLGKILEKRAGIAIQSSEIHYTDLDVLATIRRSGEPYELTPKQLMKSVLITSGSMTALLNRLEKLGLIVRTKDESDKRIKRAKLTKKGISVIDKAIKLRFEEANKSISSLDTNERYSLSGLLKKLLLNLNV